MRIARVFTDLYRIVAILQPHLRFITNVRALQEGGLARPLTFCMLGANGSVNRVVHGTCSQSDSSGILVARKQWMGVHVLVAFSRTDDAASTVKPVFRVKKALDYDGIGTVPGLGSPTGRSMVHHSCNASKPAANRVERQRFPEEPSVESRAYFALTQCDQNMVTCGRS